MKIQNDNYTKTSFKAHFINSKSLSMIEDYAVKKGKSEKLALAKKNIESCYDDVFLRVDIFKLKGLPCISFSRYTPKKGIKSPRCMKDLLLSNVKMYKSSKPCDILKFALHKVVRLGYDVPNYKLFRDVVIRTVPQFRK